MKYDIKIDEYGTKLYYVNKILHREDGPAIEYTGGTKAWFKMGYVIEKMDQLLNIMMDIKNGG